MNGDLRWTGRSGVPGLGVSVATSRHYGPALRQWDEAAAGEAAEAAAEESGGNNSGGLGARLVRLLNLRRRNTVKLPPSAAAASSEARAAVRRSQSLVTAGTRVKLGGARTAAASAGPRHADSDRAVYCDDARPGPVSGGGGYICQRCEVARPGLVKTTSPVSVPRPSVKRSVSCHQARLGRREAKKRSGGQQPDPAPAPDPAPDPAPAPGGAATTKVPQLSAVLRTNDRGSNPRHRLLLPTPVTVTSAATQTEPPQQYDYAYSATLPVPPPRDSSRQDTGPRLEAAEEDSGNIYEEIRDTGDTRDSRDSREAREARPGDGRMFYSISRGRRELLELYRFADWDLGEKVDKDNYIQPSKVRSAINKTSQEQTKTSLIKSSGQEQSKGSQEQTKSSLNKKSSLRKLKTKEQRSVTFSVAGDEEEEEARPRDPRRRVPVQRSRSVAVSSHTLSKHN